MQPVVTETGKIEIENAATDVLKHLAERMPHTSAACMVEPRDLSVACNHSMTHAQQQALHEMQQLPLYSTVEKVVQCIHQPPDMSQDTIPNTQSTTCGTTDSAKVTEQQAAVPSLLVAQCFVLLCLCRPKLQKLLDEIVATEQSSVSNQQDPCGLAGALVYSVPRCSALCIYQRLIKIPWLFVFKSRPNITFTQTLFWRYTYVEYECL